jgi:acetyltransferase-like isoleucine patch superfamily enzyme
MTTDSHPLRPGAVLKGDWFDGRVPENISVGTDCRIDSSFCFKHFYSKRNPALLVGHHVTFWRTSLATEAAATIEIGSHCIIANASLVCVDRISIGSEIFIAGGVTIIDSDFHPLDPALRLRDLVALSPVGDRSRRPPIESRPVAIGDGVWIGFNATIGKGVRVGEGAVIWPGAVVLDDVPPDTVVGGNPARPLAGGEHEATRRPGA